MKTCPAREGSLAIEKVECLAEIDNRDGVSTAYVNAVDPAEFSGPVPLSSEAPDKRTGGVEDHNFRRARVRDYDSALGEESGTLHAVERNLIPTIQGI